MLRKPLPALHPVCLSTLISRSWSCCRVWDPAVVGAPGRQHIGCVCCRSCTLPWLLRQHCLVFFRTHTPGLNTKAPVLRALNPQSHGDTLSCCPCHFRSSFCSRCSSAEGGFYLPWGPRRLGLLAGWRVRGRAWARVAAWPVACSIIPTK